MKPMLKYRGGKAREIAYFEKYIPREFDTYYEPFLGAGAVYFYLEPQKAVVNDVNERLMRFYAEVKDRYEEVRAELDGLQALYEAHSREYAQRKKDEPGKKTADPNEELYYRMRDMFNQKIPKEYLDSVLYFFINKTAYSGMIRYNAQGEYNVPYGRYRNFNAGRITEAHSRLLQRTKLLTGDYAIPFQMAGEKDFMFLDPPYDCTFHDYGNLACEKGFDEAQHRRLAAEFRKLKCRALMVIGKTELTEELYGDYKKDEYFKSYAVNIRNRFKAEAKHIIVTNYEIGRGADREKKQPM